MEDKKKKLIYETPSIDVMELKYDAVLCISNPTLTTPYDDEGEDW